MNIRPWSFPKFIRHLFSILWLPWWSNRMMSEEKQLFWTTLAVQSASQCVAHGCRRQKSSYAASIRGALYPTRPHRSPLSLLALMQTSPEHLEVTKTHAEDSEASEKVSWLIRATLPREIESGIRVRSYRVSAGAGEAIVLQVNKSQIQENIM